jgi:hypothetical protein
MAATIIVYAGAIIVTFLFVIMLAQQSGLSDADLRSREPALATVAGFFLLADLQRRRGLGVRAWWSALLLGLGGFQLYDGIVQHKILGLHQVREGVPNETPYDVAFIGIALLVLVAGLALARRRPDEPERGGGGASARDSIPRGQR